MIVKDIRVENDKPFTLIAGPCVVETREHAIFMATEIKKICADLNIPVIYKSSFDKANRTSLHSFRGNEYTNIDTLHEISQTIMPVVTDVHTEMQCIELATKVDMLQIPAFLCRQTELLLVAGSTNAPINIKKGQFLSPEETQFVVEKVRSTGNYNVSICERGTTFGYNNLVVDFRSLDIMKDVCKCPVIFDATHSVQRPGGLNGKSGGNREFVLPLAKAAVAIGVAAVFMEVHHDPDNAPSDGPNMVKLSDLPTVLAKLKQIDQVVKER